jgi:hypothetical protein
MMKLDPSGNVLLHDPDLNYIPFHTLFFAFCLAKAVVMIKRVRGVIIFLNFKSDGAGGGKCGDACL